MVDKGKRRTPEDSDGSSPAGDDELPERWSAQRKTELVLRLLRGDAIDSVSRESKVPGSAIHRRRVDQ